MMAFAYSYYISYANGYLIVCPPHSYPFGLIIIRVWFQYIGIYPFEKSHYVFLGLSRFKRYYLTMRPHHTTKPSYPLLSIFKWYFLAMRHHHHHMTTPIYPLIEMGKRKR